MTIPRLSRRRLRQVTPDAVASPGVDGEFAAELRKWIRTTA
jgi:hypothetical protein